MEPSEYTTPEQIADMRRELEEYEKKGRPRPRPGKIIEWALFSLAVLVLSGALIAVQTAKNAGETPSLLGWYLFSVQSGSMEPTLPVGSVLLCRRPGDPARLAANTIVTFRTLSGDIVTHRITGLETVGGETAYRTKGDNPINSPDPDLLTPDRVIAVFVLKIPLT